MQSHTQNPVTKAKRKRRKKARPNLPVHYAIVIKDWRWDFSFGVSLKSEMHRGPYSEYRHLEIEGELVVPQKIKATEVHVVLLPDARLNHPERESHAPLSAGSIHVHRGYFQALLSCPLDALPTLIPMLIAGRTKCVVMTGDKLRYGHAQVQRYRLQTSLDEDDLPSDTTG